MSWSINDPMGNESFKCRWEIVRYTRGRGLDLGSGVAKTYQHWISVDNCADTALFGMPINPDVKVATCEKLDLFTSASMDFVFSSHLLEHFEAAKIPKVLTEWCRVIKPHGYLVLYVPDADEYPRIGQVGANPDHKVDITYDGLIEWMDAVPRGWDLIDYQKRNQANEYSHYCVFEVLS